jgi:hypothetical protein
MLQPMINIGGISSALMGLDSFDDEETVRMALRRRYASFAAWIARTNRVEEPARLPEPTRLEQPARNYIASRQPNPARPE